MTGVGLVTECLLNPSRKAWQVVTTYNRIGLLSNVEYWHSTAQNLIRSSSIAWITSPAVRRR